MHREVSMHESRPEQQHVKRFGTALPLLLVLVMLSTSVLKQREVPSTGSSFYVSVLYTAMLGTSNAAVVLGCF